MGNLTARYVTLKYSKPHAKVGKAPKAANVIAKAKAPPAKLAAARKAMSETKPRKRGRPPKRKAKA